MIVIIEVSRELYTKIKLAYISGDDSYDISIPYKITYRVVSTLIFNSHVTPGHKYCIIQKIDDDKAIVIGFILYYHSHDYNFKRSKILDLLILEDFRGKQFGSEVIKYVLYEAKQYGALFVTLFVFHRNQGALNFYRKLGFCEFRKFDKGNYLLRTLSDLPIH